MVEPGESFSSTVSLTPAMVSDFARRAGDLNPLHHDPRHAATTRYGRPIASGPHTTALLMALSATHFSQRGGVVGLEFNFRFKKAIFADETIRLEWRIVSVTPHLRMGGDIVEMKGRIVNEAGETALEGKGRVLVSDQL